MSLEYGRVKLSSANIIYSFGDLYPVLKRGFRLTGIYDRKPASACFLGGGFMSGVELLRKNNVLCPCDVVEVDPVVVALARKWLSPSIFENVTVHICDAYEFILSCTNKQWELLVVDAFIDLHVPESLRSVECLQACAERLTPKRGILLFNIFGGNIPYLELYLQELCQTMKSTLGEITELRIGNNSLFLWEKK